MEAEVFPKVHFVPMEASESQTEMREAVCMVMHHVFQVETQFHQPTRILHQQEHQIQPTNFDMNSDLCLALDVLIRVVTLLGLRVGIVIGNGSRGLSLSSSALLCAANPGGSPLGDAGGLLRGGRAFLPAHLDRNQAEALPGGLGVDSKLIGDGVELLKERG